MKPLQMKFDDPLVRQRGRASIDFLRQLIVARKPLADKVDQALAASEIQNASIPDDLDQLNRHFEQILEPSDAFGALNLIAEWHYRNYGAIAAEAFEEIADELVPILSDLSEGPTKLTLDPNLVPPTYWDGVYFHRTEGGWDGHPYMGYIHGEFIHKKLIGELTPGGIHQTRLDVAAMAPRNEYDRILDMGCSSGHYTAQLAKVYPGAKIVGVDLSVAMLKYALQTGNHLGLEWDLYQCAAEATPFDDESFDLVTSYILLHEMPPDAIRAMFKEAYRLLQRGGDLLMADVPRYASLDKVAVWKADREARLGGEPHWRASASLDFAKLVTEAGFVNAKASGKYPHVVIASKPR